MAGPVGPAIPAFNMLERLALVLGPRCTGRRAVAGTFSMPSRIRRVSVGLLVDVGRCRDADDREQNHPTGDSPAAVRIRGYIAVNVVGHRGNVAGHGSARERFFRTPHRSRYVRIAYDAQPWS